MFNFGYATAVREMKKKEEIPPPFLDDPLFAEMLAKLESKVSLKLYTFNHLHWECLSFHMLKLRKQNFKCEMP